MHSDFSSLATRSWLFTPATRPERFPNAAAAGADVLIIDLEDSVAPADKATARATALDYVPRMTASGGTVTCALRINALDCLAGLSDLQALIGSEADPVFLVLPKV